MIFLVKFVNINGVGFVEESIKADTFIDTTHLDALQCLIAIANVNIIRRECYKYCY